MGSSLTDRPLKLNRQRLRIRTLSGSLSRARGLFVAAALAAFLAGCATAKPGPLLLHPVPTTRDKYSLSQGAIVFSGPDFTVSARPWDHRLVAEEFRSSGEPNPFGEDETAIGRFIFLKVRLENHSARTLVFNPMRSSLLREGEAPKRPLENSDLFVFADEESAAAEARGRSFRRVSYDITVTVRPGQELERYLVFPAPEDEVKQVDLEIADLWHGSTSFDLRFGFEAFPGK